MWQCARARGPSGDENGVNENERAREGERENRRDRDRANEGKSERDWENERETKNQRNRDMFTGRIHPHAVACVIVKRVNMDFDVVYDKGSSCIQNTKCK